MEQNFSLKHYNTFGIETSAKYFERFDTTDKLEKILSDANCKKEKLLILGGGSNILFTKNFNGLVLKNEISGISITAEDDRYVYITAGAGENWHQFVCYCIKNNLSGVENLSLIPGSVGASPIQNIGAYGVEIKDVFHSLSAYNLSDKKIEKFTLNDCEFGYRNSVFKNKYKGKFVITDVTFRLSRTPEFHIQYGAIKEELEKMGVTELSIAAVSQAVINIRQSKLPDPKVTGNAGSFFKNPEVNNSTIQKLHHNFPEMPFYKISEDQFKIPAGWLIEQCGWKGYRNGDAGCHPRQALVLVNYGQANGDEIYSLSESIKRSVKEKFSIDIETEVNII